MRRCFVTYVLLLLASHLLSGQLTTSVRLGPPTVVGDVTNISAGFPFVQWRSGHLIAWHKVKQPEGRIAVYSPKLELEEIISFHIDEAASISIVSADMTPDGKVVASGLARRSDGAEARFLALITKEGKVEHVVRTEPYLPQFICADEDGNVWTVGDWYLQNGGLKQNDFSIVREYNFTTGLVRGIVKRNQFLGERVSFGGPIHAAILRCDGRSVRLYSDVTNQWFEYGKDSGILTEADIEPFPDKPVFVTGMAITSTERILLSIQDLKSAEQQPRIFELTPVAADKKRHWSPVTGTECAPPGPCVLAILGIENGRLVLEEGYGSVMQIYRAKLLGD